MDWNYIKTTHKKAYNHYIDSGIDKRNLYSFFAQNDIYVKTTRVYQHTFAYTVKYEELTIHSKCRYLSRNDARMYATCKAFEILDKILRGKANDNQNS